MTNLCDLCGKAKDGPNRCRADIDPRNTSDVTDCNGAQVEVLDTDLVRAWLRAPLLREALREALDGWWKMIDQFGAPEEWRRRDEQHIAELRAKFLEAK
jgi:hypothetical protein